MTDCRSTQRPLAFADRYTFSGTAGQQVAVTMSSTAVDTYLYLLRGNSSAFTVLAFNDDSGNSLNSRIPANFGFLTLPATETYTIEATSLAGGSTGAYTVMLTAGNGFSVSGNVSSSGVPAGGRDADLHARRRWDRPGGGADRRRRQLEPDRVHAGLVGYTVTPTRNGFTFAPTSRGFNGARTDLAFAATPVGCGGTPIKPGQTITGALAAGDCPSVLQPGAFADRYTFTGSVAQQVAITLSSAAFDTVVSLIGPGDMLLTLNDDSGGTLNSRIPSPSGFFTLPAAGTYTIEVSSFVPGATGAYTVMLSSAATTGFRGAGQVTLGGAGLAGVTMAFSRDMGMGAIPPSVSTDGAGNWSQAGFVAGTTYRVTPVRPGLSFTPSFLTFGNTSASLSFTAAPAVCSPTPIAVGGPIVTGSLAPADCEASQRPGAFADRYTFSAMANQPVAIALSSAAFDTLLFLIGPDSMVYAFNDDSGGTLNSRIPVNTGFFVLPIGGTYTIEATSLGIGSTGAYTLSLSSPVGFSLAGRVTAGTAGVSDVTLSFTRLTGAGALPGPVAHQQHRHRGDLDAVRLLLGLDLPRDAEPGGVHVQPGLPRRRRAARHRELHGLPGDADRRSTRPSPSTGRSPPPTASR